jgi:hypothetical protein
MRHLKYFVTGIASFAVLAALIAVCYGIWYGYIWVGTNHPAVLGGLVIGFIIYLTGRLVLEGSEISDLTTNDPEGMV